MPTRLFWVICFLILVPFSHGQTTPVPRTSPGHKLTIRVRFVNAGLLWAGQQEQITKRLQEEADNDQYDGELRDLSDWPTKRQNGFARLTKITGISRFR